MADLLERHREALGNGARSDPAHLYAFVCCDCQVEEPMFFAWIEAREAWAASHAELTGHARWLTRTVDRDGRIVTYSRPSSGLPEGHFASLTLDEALISRCSCGVTVSLYHLQGFPVPFDLALAKAHG